MSLFIRSSLLIPFLAGCALSGTTTEEIVPIYESPCAVYDAGEAACDASPDESGSYADAWSSLPCADVCDALDTSDPSPLLACEPIHLAMPPNDHAGFYVVTCTYDEEGQ